MKHVIAGVMLVLWALQPASAIAGTVRIAASDGTSLSAHHQGSGEHGIVLVHSYHTDRSAWGDLAEVLVGQGMQVVAVDLRGHGASKGDGEALNMVADVEAAVAYLRGRGAKKVSLIGAGLGGNLAFAAAAKDAEVHDVVMISPRLDHNGVKMSKALRGYGRRPLLLISGGDDQLSIKASNMVADRVDTTVIEVLDADGSGMKLLNRDSRIQGVLVSWVNGAYKVAAGEGGEHDLTTNTGDKVETTGKKLGE